MGTRSKSTTTPDATKSSPKRAPTMVGMCFMEPRFGDGGLARNVFAKHRAWCPRSPQSEMGGWHFMPMEPGSTISPRCFWTRRFSSSLVNRFGNSQGGSLTRWGRPTAGGVHGCTGRSHAGNPAPQKRLEPLKDGARSSVRTLDPFRVKKNRHHWAPRLYNIALPLVPAWCPVFCALGADSDSRIASKAAVNFAFRSQPGASELSARSSAFQCRDPLAIPDRNSVG